MKSVGVLLLLGVWSSCTGTIGEPGGRPSSGPRSVTPRRFDVALVARDSASSVERVSFAIPLSRGVVVDDRAVQVFVGDRELPAASRILARYPDDSARSIQVQTDVDIGAHDELRIELGETGRGGLELVPVEDTLEGAGSETRPRVWVVLPAEVLAASTLTGPALPRDAIDEPALEVWDRICNYQRWNTDIFVQEASTAQVWLFDRVTSMYRGYAITGELSPLESAYREAAMYRDAIRFTPDGDISSIGVPGAGTDLKYHYAQGMALHYLLTGDDRFREAAEAISRKVAKLWDPHYDGSDKFWTERHAGFALLAHEWANRVSDDQRVETAARSDAAITAYLDAQLAPRFGQADPTARCFAHTSAAHGESWSASGCSPWMSAILADGLDAYARRVGGDRAVEVNSALVRLGRIIARDGRDDSGRPLYWMGVGGKRGERDQNDEHWGESAYVVALAWAASDRSEDELRVAADELVAGLGQHGKTEHLRSFNWQCRSAVMTPALLQ